MIKAKVSLTGLTFAAALLVGCASPAPEESADSGAVMVAKADGAAPVAEDKVRCKTITPIGTKIGQRICRKQSEWDEIEGAGNEFTREVQRRSAQVGNPSGN